ncbi:MAG: LptF/LptG family permease [Isosphaeraceae bacterium]|nr:LptF/LptG family permease [Isosphaeraceae bacterium]
MMRILDRQRYWSFVKAYVICYVALVGLYVVIHAFSNVDEFNEVAESTVDLFKRMGWYYLIHMSEFYDRLCGVISMMAAIFTVTWMQRNNELIAMLAAGISTQRAIRPVIISSLLVSTLSIVNQELIMPRIGEDLQKPPDDDGVRRVLVYSREDSNDILMSASGQGDRATQTVFRYNATIPVSVAGELLEVQAQQARYIPPTASRIPMRGGWLLHGARLVTRPTTDEYKKVLVKLESLDGFPLPKDAGRALRGEIYFLKSDLTFSAVTRIRQWYQSAPTIELLRAIDEPANIAESADIQVFLHNRLVRPLASVCLMLLSLPLVLGGQGRNMFMNLGFSLGTSGVFYAVSFMCQYFGGLGELSPELAAWIPLIAFGTVAVARWDTIRT